MLRKIFNIFSNTRGVVVWLSVFLSLILFQTPYLMLGRWSSLVSIAMTFVFLFKDRRKKGLAMTLSIDGLEVLLFLILALLTTIAHGVSALDVDVFAVQVLLCACLTNKVGLDAQEFRLVKWMYLSAMTVYSVLVIVSCSRSVYRYFHGDIELFNTFFDPNYIGIPIVFASVLALGEILYQKKGRLICFVMFAVYGIAILFTASRGNSVGFAFGIGLVLLYYLKDKSVGFWEKIWVIAILLIAVAILMGKLMGSFVDQIERMTTFGEDADNGRFYLWEIIINEWKKYPVFGLGLKGAARFCGHASHNTYVEILAETGIVGFIMMSIVLVRALIKSYKYDKVFFFALLTLYLQMAFLDTLINRCLWPYLCLVAIFPMHPNQCDASLQKEE